MHDYLHDIILFLFVKLHSFHCGEEVRKPSIPGSATVIVNNNVTKNTHL